MSNQKVIDGRIEVIERAAQKKIDHHLIKKKNTISAENERSIEIKTAKKMIIICTFNKHYAYREKDQ